MKRFPSLARTLWPCLLVLSIVCEARAEDPPLTHRLRVAYSSRASMVAVADSDVDGYDELFIAGKQPGVSDALVRTRIRRGKVEGTWQLSLRAGTYEGFLFTDLEDDGAGELCLAIQERESIRLEIRDARDADRLLLTTSYPTPDRDGTGDWEGRVALKTALDFDRDGTKDIVMSLSAGFDLDPRGLAIFSGTTGDVIGEFPVAGHVGSVLVSAPGAPEDAVLVVESIGLENGKQVGEFDDSQAYLVAIGTDLRVRWAKRVSPDPASLGTALADLDGDGRLELIAGWEQEVRGNSVAHLLRLLDPATGEDLRYRRFGGSVDSILVGDLDRDSRPEVIVGLRDGRIQVLDATLDQIRGENDLGASANLSLMADVDLDGSNEIVVQRGNSEVLVLNERLQPIAVHEAAEPTGGIVLARTAPDAAHLVISGRNHLRVLSLRRGGRSVATDGTSLESGTAWGLAILSALFGGAVAVLALFVGRRVRSRADRLRTAGQRRSKADLLSALAAFGHSGLARANLDRLALFASAVPDEGDSRREEFERRFAGLLHTYREITRGQLQTLEMLTRELERHNEPAAKLRDRFGALDRTLGAGNVREVLVGPHAERITSDAKDIVDAARALQRDLLGSLDTNVVEAICHVLASSEESLDAGGVTHVGLVWEGPVRAQVDDECLKTCLEIVLSNAVEAMESGTERKVEVRAASRGSSVIVTVADTGRGVPEEDRERIFERGVSTKGESRGLGLFHARQALARYGAGIRVGDSETGRGTTIVLELRSASGSPPVPGDVGVAEVVR